MRQSAKYLWISLLFYLSPFQLIANDINNLDLVIFKLYVNNKLWGQINVLCDSTKYYIHLPELLSQLEYKYEMDSVKRLFKGYLSEIDSTTYTINGDSKLDAAWNTENELYVESSVVEKIYDFKTVFTFGSLALDIVTPKAIPAILRIERQQKRLKIERERALRQLSNIDTLRPKNLKINSLGYSVNANFGTYNDIALRGNATGEFLKGSFLVNYDFLSKTYPWNQDLTFNWTKPFLQKKWLKTLRVFHDYNYLQINSRHYLTGVMISNEDRNNNFMRGHTYQGRTTPNTEVEIYNNNQLVQYLKSDSLGNYHVEIPSYEGDNTIKAISYDSFGVPKVDESMVYMPPGLQEKKRLLYIASAGFTDKGEFYINPLVEYGLLKTLTVGTSNETVFKYDGVKSIAILNAKYTFHNFLRLHLDYIPTVKWNAMLTGNIKGIMSGNILYEKYNPNQQIIDNQILEKFSVSVNGQLPIKRINGNYYINVLYYSFRKTKNYNTNFSINVWWRKLTGNISLSTAASTPKLENPILSLSVGWLLNNRWFNELAVDYKTYSNFIQLKERLNYQFSNKLNSFVEINYRPTNKSYNFSFGVSWRLPWVQLRSGVNASRGYTSSYLNASGSLLFYDEKKINFTDRYVSGSSLLVAPFLDINGDGKLSINEPIMNNTQVMIYTGAEKKKTPRGILFSGISPNQPFKIIIPRQGYEDITWQIKPQEKCLILTQYQMRTIYIPVHIISELAGQVTLNHHGQIIGIEKVPLLITHRDSGKQTKLTTDDWGYYSHIGVCGTYRIELDTEALSAMGYECDKPVRQLLINASQEGEQLDNLHFEVTKKESLKN